MTEKFAMRRSLGALSGFLLLLLGAWGGLIAFIGPYFHYAYTPATAWMYTTDRLWLEILPGGAVFLGGLLLMLTAARGLAMFGALLAAAGGAWFTLGTLLSPLWNHNAPLGGTPTGTTVTMRIVEQIGFFSGLGIAIVFIAAVALGRLMTRPPEAAPQPAAPYSSATAPTANYPTAG